MTNDIDTSSQPIETEPDVVAVETKTDDEPILSVDDIRDEQWSRFMDAVRRGEVEPFVVSLDVAGAAVQFHMGEWPHFHRVLASGRLGPPMSTHAPEVPNR